MQAMLQKSKVVKTSKGVPDLSHGSQMHKNPKETNISGIKTLNIHSWLRQDKISKFSHDINSI